MSDRPIDVEGECNSWHEFSGGTCRCELPQGHDGWHEEKANWVREHDGICWRWERDWRPEIEAEDEGFRGYQAAVGHPEREVIPEEPGEEYLANFCQTIEEMEEHARHKAECKAAASHALMLECNRPVCDKECPFLRGCERICRVCGEHVSGTDETLHRCPYCRLWFCLDHDLWHQDYCSKNEHREP